jgi:hypothetical protein
MCLAALLFFMPPAVAAPGQSGTGVIRQETDGDDAVFGFHSPNAGLGTTIATSGGEGAGELADLPPGVVNIVTGVGHVTGAAIAPRVSVPPPPSDASVSPPQPAATSITATAREAVDLLPNMGVDLSLCGAELSGNPTLGGSISPENRGGARF